MAAILNLSVDQGASYEKDIPVYESDGVTALDLTGYTLRASIRKHYKSTSATETFTVASKTLTDGILTLVLTAAQTTAVAAGRYLYDVEIVSPGTEDAIQAITMTAVGTGYTTAQVALTGGAGSSATGTAVLSSTTVASITVTAAGSGYTSDPLVTITGHGTGATAIAIRGGKVTRVVEGILTLNPEITKA